MEQAVNNPTQIFETWVRDDFMTQLEGAYDSLAQEWLKKVSAEFDRIMTKGTLRQRLKAIDQMKRGTFHQFHSNKFDPESTPIQDIIREVLDKALENDKQQRE